MNGFPKGFVWGAACASYQCEGAWDEDGKGRSIWDDYCHDAGRGHVRNDDTGDVACESYHRCAEDIALMKRIGLMAYRFSISWPRVLPEGTGRVNPAGLDYYDRLVDTLLENGIEPWVTLYHWDLPSALQEKGGWMNRATIDAFRDYSALLANRLNGRVKHFMTVNEPQCIVLLGHGNGTHAPGLKLTNGELIACFHHLALAHGAASQAIRENSASPVEIGTVPTGRLCYPEKDTPAGREAARKASFKLSDEDWMFTFNVAMDPIMFRRYPDDAPDFIREFAAAVPSSDWALMEKPDFLGVNIYNGKCVDEKGRRVRHAGEPLTACKWPVSPEVMHFGMVNLYQRYGLPIVIAENGQSCNDRVFLDGRVHDPDRIDFLHRYLCALNKAMDEGVPVQGYFHWSLLDNFEWAQGYDDRFGLVYVDYPSQRRILKDSAEWYAEVIRTNGRIL